MGVRAWVFIIHGCWYSAHAMGSNLGGTKCHAEHTKCNAGLTKCNAELTKCNAELAGRNASAESCDADVSGYSGDVSKGCNANRKWYAGVDGLGNNTDATGCRRWCNGTIT
eukprot:9081815-Pyramimonas_sp.AAC.1